jgi:hypothetical protein
LSQRCFKPERASIADFCSALNCTGAAMNRSASGNSDFCACSTVRYSVAPTGAATNAAKGINK